MIYNIYETFLVKEIHKLKNFQEPNCNNITINFISTIITY